MNFIVLNNKNKINQIWQVLKSLDKEQDNFFQSK